MKKLLLLTITTALFTFCDWRIQEKVIAESGLIIENVNIVDVINGELLENKTVWIFDGIIQNIYDGEIEIADSVEIVNGIGKYLIPGLWDMHTHYNWNYTYSNNLLIANGVTGIREMWGEMETIKKIRKQTQDGYIIAPEIYSAGNIIDGVPKIWPGSAEVANSDAANEVVSGQIEEGVDFLKVYSMLSKESYMAIAKMSRETGVPFAGHVPMSVSIWEAMEAGQHSFEHLYGMLEASVSNPEELAEIRSTRIFGPEVSNMLVDNFDRVKFDSLATILGNSNTWVSPTLIVLKNIANLDDSTMSDDPKLEYMPKFMQESWDPSNDFRFQNAGKEYYDASRRKYFLQLSLMGDLEKAGVKFIAGTDYMNPYCYPGFSLHDELQLMVEGGVSNAGALRAATYNASLFMDRMDVGTVEEGKMASLVLLNGNPLEDISNTSRINAVIFRGSYFNSDRLSTMLDEAKEIAANTDSDF